MNKVKQAIFVDWGTSQLKAYFVNIDHNNQIELIDKTIGLGANQAVGQFEAVLAEVIAPWSLKSPNCPILLAGQITSNIGWIHTPYIQCPTALDKIANQCVTTQFQQHPLVCSFGLTAKNGSYADVLRGEEIFILGYLSNQKQHSQLLCLPGTHCKWVNIEDGVISSFFTSMTGELFALLSKHSMLIQQQGQFSQHAFNQGVATRCNAVASLSELLFCVRTKQIDKSLSVNDAASFLSGLLIADDVLNAKTKLAWQQIPKAISIIGNPLLADLYQQVFNVVEQPVNKLDIQNITLAGFSALYHQINEYDAH